jgi:hypothetical protein
MLGFPLSPAVAKALYNVNLWGGLALFSVFISFDTAKMIHDARLGETDHVSHSLSLFLSTFPNKAIVSFLFDTFTDELLITPLQTSSISLSACSPSSEAPTKNRVITVNDHQICTNC